MPKLHTLVLAGGLVLACPALAEPPPPIEDFVRHPTYSGTSISPTGEYLAITVDRGDQDVLTVLRTSDLKILKINQLPDKKSVGSFHWVSTRSEEHTSELQSLMRISYAVFCLKKKKYT